MEDALTIVGRAYGPPEVLTVEATSVGAPESDELTIRQDRIGVNFIDILKRRGTLGGDVPYRLGLEAAGTVTAVGGRKSDFAVGDRVIYVGGDMGSYTSLRNVSMRRVLALPNTVSSRDAVAVLFKGLTADYLAFRMRPIKPGDFVLVHAAAGGVSTLLIPLLKSMGAKVIGTVGDMAKAPYAIALGCDSVLDYSSEDVAAKVRLLTDGAGVSIAYDSVGAATIDASLKSLARFGLLVSFGWASGDIEPLSLSRLRDLGSVFVTRPTVSHYTEQREDLVAAGARVFSNMESGLFKVQIHAELPLPRATEAHRLIESRTTTGAVVLEV